MLRFERFTERAQDAAARAYEILQRYGQNQVDTEHILLALLEQPAGTVPQLLESFTVNVNDMRTRLDEILRASPKKAIYGQGAKQVFITPRVKRVIDLANEEANRLGDEYISTEHLFLAILSEQNTAVAKILVDSGAAHDPTLEAIKNMPHARREPVKGAMVEPESIPLRHDRLTAYLRQLLDAYFALNPIGTVVSAPYIMTAAALGSGQSPDLQIILKTNPGKLTETAMVGSADICIEVVSQATMAEDYGEKFAAYEEAGVSEYWIFDPLRKETRFLHLQPSGLYLTHSPDADGSYRTPILPRFALHVPTLWQDTLPNILAIVQAAQATLK